MTALGRKFVLIVGVLVTVTLLLLGAFISSDIFSNIVVMSLGLYFSANVTTKFVTTQHDNK